jgi:transcriptional regulator with GAF, ATPase, and Fis domain
MALPSGRDLLGVREAIRGTGIPLVGESAEFFELLRSIERIARHSVGTVLIRGETGTGKELIARAIHYLGGRRDYPFVPVNCGALPESLAENELFGHRPGAFTGATQETTGLVRLAHKGTLFLDEVDSLPAKAQAALLRFLQDGHFRPLGAAREEQADVRIVAACNRSLEEEIRAGRFRQDLFYRLNLIALDVPPLRARAGDVHVLSKYFLQQCVERYRLPRKQLHAGTVSWFEQYSWPGNIRELENLLYRECLLGDGEELQIKVPPTFVKCPAPLVPSGSALGVMSYQAAKAHILKEFDRTYLTDLLQRAQGNVTKAAALAGKERRALGKLLKRYQIVHVADQSGYEPAR